MFRKPIKGTVDLVKKIVGATVCLHNYLRLTENASYIPTGFVDSEDSSGNIIPGDWRNEVQGDGLRNLQQVGGNRYSFDASLSRDAFMQYFINPEGSVSWHCQHARNVGNVRFNP